MPPETNFRDAYLVNDVNAHGRLRARLRIESGLSAAGRSELRKRVPYFGGGGTRSFGSFFAARARIVSASSLYCSISRRDGAIRSSG